MRRVSIVGVPGSGKTTLGRHLADLLQVPFVELDGIFHQPGWTELARDDFRSRVGDRVAADAWVVDGNYSAVQDLVWARADTVLWLDLSRSVVMRRVIARTVRRAITREQLWNGNREPLTNLYRLDESKNIIRWAWVRHAVYAERYAQEMHAPARNHLEFIRLRSVQEVMRFLDRVTSP